MGGGGGRCIRMDGSENHILMLSPQKQCPQTITFKWEIKPMSSIYQTNSNTLLLLARPKWHNIYMMPSAAAKFVR